jgi:hypothetical protein
MLTSRRPRPVRKISHTLCLTRRKGRRLQKVPLPQRFCSGRLSAGTARGLSAGNCARTRLLPNPSQSLQQESCRLEQAKLPYQGTFRIVIIRWQNRIPQAPHLLALTNRSQRPSSCGSSVAPLLRDWSGWIRSNCRNSRDPKNHQSGASRGGPDHSDIGATRLKLPAIHIETSVDAATPGTGEPLTPEGDACIPDEDIAISSWGSDDPAAEQITTARQSLVGEFDRPNPQNIEILARLYLFLGLGAEARQTMVAFGVTMDGSGLLDDIGRILDDEPVASGSVLRRMQECNSAVALWAFLAAPEVEEARLTPVAAVVRGFLSLPPQLRLTLSTRLSDRLIEIGALDAARTIARSLSHQPDGDSRRASLIGARLDLKLGQTEQAEAQLAAIPAGNDALSASAIELATQTRLGRGERIDPKLVEAIASLAFEHQANPDGGRLASLEVVARASSGDFKGAFSALDRWSRDQPDMDRAATAHDLFDLLAKRATDSDFIVLFFRERQALQEARSDPQLRLSLGRRLAELGFAEEVAQVLSDETGNTKEGKILRARAELALFHPDAAIDLVEGLVGDDATQIRAQAKVMQGQSPSEVKPAAENRQTPEAARDEATGAVAGTLAGSRAMLQASTDLRQSILTSLAKDGAAAPQP